MDQTQQAQAHYRRIQTWPAHQQVGNIAGVNQHLGQHLMGRQHLYLLHGYLLTAMTSTSCVQRVVQSCARGPMYVPRCSVLSVHHHNALQIQLQSIGVDMVRIIINRNKRNVHTAAT